MQYCNAMQAFFLFLPLFLSFLFSFFNLLLDEETEWRERKDQSFDGEIEYEKAEGRERERERTREDLRL